MMGVNYLPRIRTFGAVLRRYIQYRQNSSGSYRWRDVSYGKGVRVPAIDYFFRNNKLLLIVYGTYTWNYKNSETYEIYVDALCLFQWKADRLFSVSSYIRYNVHQINALKSWKTNTPLSFSLSLSPSTLLSHQVKTCAKKGVCLLIFSSVRWKFCAIFFTAWNSSRIISHASGPPPDEQHNIKLQITKKHPHKKYCMMLRCVAAAAAAAVVVLIMYIHVAVLPPTTVIVATAPSNTPPQHQHHQQLEESKLIACWKTRLLLVAARFFRQ